MFGRWHQKWAAAQQSYLQFLHSKLSIRRWTAALIHKLYLTAWDLWEHRNRILHASIVGPRAIAERARVDAALQTAYDHGSGALLPPERDLFHQPMNRLLSSTIATKRRWTHSVNLSHQLAQDRRQLDAAYTQLRRQQQLMQNWLRPPADPPSPDL
jgi:hypothetical protein